MDMLANQHTRWELNDLAQRLEKQEPIGEPNEAVCAPPVVSEPA